MGRKEASTGLKRKAAPRFWPIHRKEKVWTVRPSPGPHSLKQCIPIAVILRDILGFVNTRKEGGKIVTQGDILVDGRLRKKDNFPVGLMDVVSIPSIKRYFRVLPGKKGLLLYSITKKESKFKLCRIEEKKTVKDGKKQLNLHDGSNLLLKDDDQQKTETPTLAVQDTLKISLPERQVLQHIPMKEKGHALIVRGKNRGKSGRVLKIERTEGKKRGDLLTTIEDEAGEQYRTILGYVYAIGEAEPVISLPEREK